MLLRLLIAILAVLAGTPVFAQWTWSPDARHHAAVVKVSITGQAGSGALISASPGIVATAKHVVERGGISPTAAIGWSNGYRTTGRLIGSGAHTDLAFYSVDVPENAVTTPLADAMPSVGDTVEICGYGGPTQRLRHFTGKVLTSTADELTVDAPVISGDSGGAILHNGRLVAINWGARTAHAPAFRAEDGDNWPLVYPATGWGLGPIQRILTQCQGGSCPPQGGAVWGGIGIGGGRIRYSQPQRGGATAPPLGGSPPEHPPARDLTPVPPTSPRSGIPELQKAIDDLRNYLEQREARPCDPSPKKPDCPAPPAQAPSPCALSEADVKRIAAQVVSSMEGNPAFQGPPGAKGEKGDPGQAAKPANIHIDALAAEVIKKLPPVKLEIHSQGKVQRKQAPLGSPIAIGQKDRAKK